MCNAFSGSLRYQTLGDRRNMEIWTDDDHPGKMMRPKLMVTIQIPIQDWDASKYNAVLNLLGY